MQYQHSAEVPNILTSARFDMDLESPKQSQQQRLLIYSVRQVKILASKTPLFSLMAELGESLPYQIPTHVTKVSHIFFLKFFFCDLRC